VERTCRSLADIHSDSIIKRSINKTIISGTILAGNIIDFIPIILARITIATIVNYSDYVVMIVCHNCCNKTFASAPQNVTQLRLFTRRVFHIVCSITLRHCHVTQSCHLLKCVICYPTISIITLRPIDRSRCKYDHVVRSHLSIPSTRLIQEEQSSESQSHFLPGLSTGKRSSSLAF
jgi:hypothetical protein